VNRRLEGTIQRLEVAVRTDDLTELMNRRWLDLTLEARWIEAQRHDQDLGLIMIDLDRFKQLNDQRGHLAGDEVLRLVGRVLRETCREIDTPARYGGDEFCVLLPHATMEATMAVGHRILASFRAALVARDLEGIVDMSVGVANRSLSLPVDAQSLLQEADEAMYVAKQGGRRLVISSPSVAIRRSA
jgi:diguanylate cyclase (GGDEF)-like protein